MAAVVLTVFIAILYVKNGLSSHNKDNNNFQITIDDLFTNFSMYQLSAYNERDRAALYNLHVKDQGILYYSFVTNQAVLPMKVLIKNNYMQRFNDVLQNKYIQSIQLSMEYYKQRVKLNAKNSPLDPSQVFLTYEAIDKWASKLQNDLPMIITKKSIGTTYEKRDILLIKMSLKKRNSAVFIYGGENGKDWMSVAIILNYINKLIKKSNAAPEPNILDYHDLYIIPVGNPDGYKYNVETNKIWMKNRKFFFPKKLCHNGRDATGVNIDRNWRLDETGATGTECNGIYLGDVPVSEEETKALFKILNSNAVKIMAFICVKGYGQMITIPYADAHRITNNHALMMEILPAVTDKVKEIYNESFFYGPTSTFLYNYSANVADYIKNKLNIPIVYTVWLQHKQDVFPVEENIPILTRQFDTILNETLMLAKDIYGPLFNKQTNYKSFNMISFVIMISIWFLSF